MPKVFIIIVNWNGWPDTEECLRSLEKVEYENFEVILIDNGSINSYQLPADSYRLKITAIYLKENLGFAGGNNVGIKMALERGADYVLLLNNDTVVTEDFLGEMVAQAEIYPRVGILGPLILDYADHDKIQFAGGKLNWSMTRGIHLTEVPTPQSQRDGSWKYITGCCLLIKREVIDEIGLLDEDYFLYYEDADWCVRAQYEDWQCAVVPVVRIYHKLSRSAQEFSYSYIYYHTRNGLIFGVKFGDILVVLLLSGWIFLKQLIKLAIGYKRAWAWPVLRGVIDFWRGKSGKLILKIN